MVGILTVVLTGIINPVMTTGPDALGFNPAQLAYPGQAKLACQILNLTMGMENNSFSVAQYNRSTGTYLSDRAKANLIGSIPAGGFRGSGYLDGGLASFGYGHLAVSLRMVADGEAVLPRDMFELVLRGNELGRVYRAEPLAGIAQLVLKTGIGGATVVGHNLFVGAAAHYLHGMSCAELVEASAHFVTTPQALVGEGRGTYRTASGGSGCAFDFGAACRLEDWWVSLGVLNVSPGISWSDGVEERQYVFTLDSANVFELLRGKGWQDELRLGTTDRFTTMLPVQTNVGLARRFRDWLSGSFTLRARWRKQPQSSLRIRPAVTIEAWPWRWLGTGTTLSFEPGRGVGMGLVGAAVWKRLTVAAAMESMGGLAMGARGVQFQFSVGYGTSAASKGAERPDVLRLTPGVN